MSQQKVAQTFGTVKKCEHGNPQKLTGESVLPCECCENELGFFIDGKLCPVCRLGIKRTDVPKQSLPDDYIEDRGPVHRVFADERAMEEAPSGYLKLILGTTEERSTFTTFTPIEQIPWPFETGTVVEAELGAIVCRLPLPIFIDVMCEAHRVLVSNGLFTISAPFHLHDHYTRDLRNITPICEDTFGFFSKEWSRKNGVEMYSDQCDFSPAGIRFHQEEEWTSRADRAKSWAGAHYWGVVKRIDVVLKAVK